MLQISAPITFGSSGGGLFDEEAQLVGITTRGMESANLNFAIPSDVVLQIYEKGKLFGKNSGGEYEALSSGFALSLSQVLRGDNFFKVRIDDPEQRRKYEEWIDEMTQRLKWWLPDQSVEQRRDLIELVWYESKRAGIAPDLSLALIQVSSKFQRMYISKSGARGYFAIDPSWTRKVGDGDPTKLYIPQISVRLGLSILRFFIDQERGDLFLALGKWAGQPGKPEFPNIVQDAWVQWEFKR